MEEICAFSNIAVHEQRRVRIICYFGGGVVGPYNICIYIICNICIYIYNNIIVFILIPTVEKTKNVIYSEILEFSNQK